MKKLIIFFLLFYIIPNTKAQLAHYLSYNALMYGYHPNKEKEKWFDKDFLLPQDMKLSYRIAKMRHSIELYHTISFHNYVDNSKEDKKGDVWTSYIQMLGLNYGYQLLQNKRIEIYPFLGLNMGWYFEDYTIHVFENHRWNEIIGTTEEEKLLGIQGGVSALAFISKGLYTNLNCRYTVNPNAKYKNFKNNMLLELGLGYKIQRKKK